MILWNVYFGCPHLDAVGKHLVSCLNIIELAGSRTECSVFYPNAKMLGLCPDQATCDPLLRVTLTKGPSFSKAVASSQQYTQVLSPVSEMERGSSEPPVARSTGSGRSTSTGPMPIPRSSSISCHPHPGSKKHKRTPLYQRSVRRRVCWRLVV